MADSRVFAGRPTVLGHRGLGRGTVDGHAENSLESILAAAHSGLRWVELDARRTADDELVVGH
jgi:glycerophosphoryl diester phosphodiesterase